MLPGNPGPSSCHTDGGQDSRVRLRATAFIADCPEGSGGWCGWPRSHVPIWEQRWRQMQEANLRQAERGGAEVELEEEGLTLSQRKERRKGEIPAGETDAVMERVQREPPVEVHGPRGTVVLWHALLAHAVGGNRHADVIRIASIYEYHKTPASLPDATMRARAGALPGGVQPGIWEDWAPAVREQAAGREAAAKL